MEVPMRIAVIGASGRTGRATVTHALRAGHEVVSVVRNPARAPEGTVVATADARDATALTAAVSGADAVVTCLGQAAGEQDATLLREGAEALLAAMAAGGPSRLVAVSAAAAYVAGDDPVSRFVAKPLLERMLKANNVDTRAMEAVIRAGSTDWTLLRPARLIQGTSTADYRARIDKAVWWHYSTRFDTVGRAAVDSLTTPNWIRHAVFVTG
jgi:putative NADH-flavin reductase